MPWLSSGSSLLTTSDGETGGEFGSIISKSSNAPSWIKETDPNPTVVWYWMKEAPGMDFMLIISGYSKIKAPYQLYCGLFGSEFSQRYSRFLTLSDMVYTVPRQTK